MSIHRDALAAVSQGITTIVGGQDGGSPFPLAEFFEGLEAAPAAVNIAAYAGHGRLRREVMGDDFRRVANGVLVYSEGRTTGEHPGRVLKRE